VGPASIRIPLTLIIKSSPEATHKNRPANVPRDKPCGRGGAELLSQSIQAADCYIVRCTLTACSLCKSEVPAELGVISRYLGKRFGPYGPGLLLAGDNPLRGAQASALQRRDYFAFGLAENAAQPKPIRQLTLETFLRGAVQRMVGGLGVSSSEVSIQGGRRPGRMLGTTGVSLRLIFCPSRMY